MKLVDILASELKHWPSTRTAAVGQSNSGSLHLNEEPRHGSEFFGWTTCKFTMAEDCQRAWVTRDEWQASVDALNAPKVVEWDGDRLPPTGTVCEHFGTADHTNWIEVQVIGHGHVRFHDVAFFEYMSGTREHTVSYSTANNFRPIRTAEQVAAKERKSEILEMIDTFGTDTAIWGRDAVMEICGHLWESGYRKEKKQCGS